MSRLLAVAARELRERWLLFPGALVSGCFPLVLPAFGVKRELMPVVGIVGAVFLGLGAAVVIGSSMLARDAANGRLGFLFSRPVSWPAIWGGKWLAAVVLVASTVGLAMIPWMIGFPLASLGGHHGDSWRQAMANAPGSAFFLVLIFIGIGLANFNGTLYRSRSTWLIVDFSLLLFSFWAIRRYVAPLWLYGVIRLDDWVPALTLLPLALGFLVGSLPQVAVGRTDLRRAHRALSLGFWAVVTVALAAAAGYWQWVRSAGPADVNVHAVTRDPAGRWVYLEASWRHSGRYPHRFLIDTANARYTADPEPRWDRSTPPLGLLFSADGRWAALPQSDDRGAALALFDLTGATLRLAEVALESSPPPTWTTAFALSPAAASIFLAHESGASLYALPSGRRVATTTIEPGWRPAVLRFLAEGEARVWLVPNGRERAEMRVVDLAKDGRSRALTFPIARALHSVEGWRSVAADVGGRRILTRDGGLHLRDGASGETIATLAEGASGGDPLGGFLGGRLDALFLADGRIVVGGGPSGIEANMPRASLQVFDRDGLRLGETRLDLGPGRLSVGPEVAPGRVAVSSFRSPFVAEDTLVVDAGEGRVVERLSGLRPAMGFFWNVSAVSADAGPTSVHFFRDVEGRVIRIDFATGERKVVAGPGAPPGERVSVR